MGNVLVISQPTQQQLVDYANAISIVNNYAYSITNQNLPVLNDPPSNYASFATSFAPAKQDALNWTDNIFVEMVQMPNTIKSQAANLFNMEETMIEAYLQMLIADPNNSAAKTNLNSSLNTVVQIIQNQLTAINDLETQLATFTTNIANDAKTLTTISSEALADAGSDQNTITQLNTDIETLKSEISTAQTLLTVSEIGMGLSIFVGIIGAVVCFIPGAQAVGVGIIIVAVGGEAASIAGTVIENERIQAMQSQITSDYAQITGLNQDIIQLTAVSGQFNDLYNANLQATNALTDIKAMWQNLQAAVTDVNTDLTDVNNDVSASQYTQALSDFQEAEANWNDVVTFATALAGINYSWQDSQGNWHNYGVNSPSVNAGNVNMIQPVPA